MKRLKSYFKSTMTEERLYGLVMNKKKELTEFEVLQQFSKTLLKRLKL
jgi:nitrogenase subunit NifH